MDGTFEEIAGLRIRTIKILALNTGHVFYGTLSRLYLVSHSDFLGAHLQDQGICSSGKYLLTPKE